VLLEYPSKRPALREVWAAIEASVLFFFPPLAFSRSLRALLGFPPGFVSSIDLARSFFSLLFGDVRKTRLTGFLFSFQPSLEVSRSPFLLRHVQQVDFFLNGTLYVRWPGARRLQDSENAVGLPARGWAPA